MNTCHCDREQGPGYFITRQCLDITAFERPLHSLIFFPLVEFRCAGLAWPYFVLSNAGILEGSEEWKLELGECIGHSIRNIQPLVDGHGDGWCGVIWSLVNFVGLMVCSLAFFAFWLDVPIAGFWLFKGYV